jgi:stearoyl-CoA desaturase (delta-9 desaturase)
VPGEPSTVAALPQRWREWRRQLLAWFDNSAGVVDTEPERIEWLRVVPFVGMHVACLAVLFVGSSATAVAVALGLYALRMFAVTAFYHRYFSHRAFKTSRTLQLVFAVLGASAVQRGPLWWAAHHRHHHAHADRPKDPHSPKQHGFLWSHMGWFLARANFPTKRHLVPDLVRYPELGWLDRFDAAVPAALGVLLYVTGAALERFAPGLGTNGWQLVVWGFVVSTVAVWHVTFAINSLAHTIGRRPHATRDDSRNNFGLALLTFGEGWHNNHHRYPSAARQGFRWWEIDITYYVLRLFAAVGLVWELRGVPAALRAGRAAESAP